MMSTYQAILEVGDVHKSYPLGRLRVPALRGVDLKIYPGDFLALTGPSGSGKTTLLNLIGCIDKPDDGTIRLEGRDVTGEPLHRLAGVRRNKLGFIFQTFNLVPVLTAFENVEYPLLLSGVGRKERHRRVWEWMERVMLPEQAGQRPDQLSGGQRQRVAIARALVMDPAIVLADEPTANLDSETALDILDLLSQLNRELGRTFVFATHDPVIFSRAGRRVSLRDGKIVSDETVGETEEEMANVG